MDYVNRLRNVYSDTTRKGKPSSKDPFLDVIRKMKDVWKNTIGRDSSIQVFNDNFKLVIDTLEVHIGQCSMM